MRIFSAFYKKTPPLKLQMYSVWDRCLPYKKRDAFSTLFSEGRSVWSIYLRTYGNSLYTNQIYLGMCHICSNCSKEIWQSFCESWLNSLRLKNISAKLLKLILSWSANTVSRASRSRIQGRTPSKILQARSFFQRYPF